MAASYETRQSFLLGWNYLLRNYVLQDLSHAKLQLWDVSVSLLSSKDFVPMCCIVSLATTMNLLPLRETVVPVYLIWSRWLVTLLAILDLM